MSYETAQKPPQVFISFYIIKIFNFYHYLINTIHYFRYKCKYEECDKAYHSIQELNRHHRHHLGKSFICDICNKAWYTAGELDRHKRYHNPVRQHQCNFCFKSFVGRGQLRIHEMAHRGERPFVCEFCSFSFTIRYKLKRHQVSLLLRNILI